MLATGLARCVVVLACVGALACNGDEGSDSSGGGGPNACEWRKAQSRRDEGCLGTDLTCTVYHYDEDGHEIGAHRDRGCDDATTPDSYCEQHDLDAMGRKIASRASSACNDVVTDCSEFSYADDGTVTERVDYGCDGTFTCHRYREDEHGNELFWESDDGCDGTPDNCRSGRFDAQGRVIGREYDHDCDGTPETCASTEYGADPTKARLASDDGCDGMPEECYEHTFDAEGRLVHDVGFVSCSDDTPRSCTDFLVDEHGNRTGIEFDSNCDGTPDNCAYTSFECAP